MGWREWADHVRDAGLGPDDVDPDPAEVVDDTCPVCLAGVRVPKDESDPRNRCCSPVCVAAHDEWEAGQREAARAAEAAWLEAQLVEGPCGWCGTPMKALRPDFETKTAFCSRACEQAAAAAIWGVQEPAADPDDHQ
jgi:hypothetical protein